MLILDGNSVYGAKSALLMTFFILVGGFIGYFVAAMLLTKSFRVFHQWKGFALLAAVLIVLCGLIEFDVFGLEKFIPEADEIEAVYMTGGIVLE